MFDFGGNIDQAMGIILAYTGRISFFGVTLTEMIVTVVVLPWAIWVFQRLVKTFLPMLDFDPVTNSLYDPEWHDERDSQAIDNYLNGVSDPESDGAISRYRQRGTRLRKINKHY